MKKCSLFVLAGFGGRQTLRLLILSWLPLNAFAASRVVAWGDNSYGETNVPINLTNAVALAAGERHSVALKADGTVVAWGDNSENQANVPSGLTNVIAIASGTYHNLALKSDGTVVAWGQNVFGQTNVPVDLSNVVAVVGTTYHSVALKSDGTVVGWGSCPSGEETDVPAGLSNLVAIASGLYHSLALKSDGTLAAWGNNWWGQLSMPPELTGVASAAAGVFHSLALKTDGSVVVWGDNSYGQTNVPPDLSNVVAVAAGGSHSLALKSDGTVVAWGNNSLGQTRVPAGLNGVVAVAGGASHSLALVGGGPPAITLPLPGRVVADTMAVSIYVQAAGAFPLNYQWSCNGTILPGATNAILALPEVQLTDAGLYSVVVSNALGTATSSCTLDVAPIWITRAPQDRSSFRGGDAFFEVAVTGRALSYQWSLNGIELPSETNASLLLTDLEFDRGGTYSVLFGNSSASVRLSATLFVSCLAAWGDNTYGQLNVPMGLTNIVSIAAGSGHTLALKSDGTVVAWGDNTLSQTNVPGGLSNVVAIAAGGNGSVALKSDGKIVVWGYSSPPSWMSNVVAVAARSGYYLALDGRGALTAWGPGAYVPSGLSNVVAIAGGLNHSLAVKADGTVAAWGANSQGQADVPSGLSNVVGVAGGVAHSVALKADGKVAAWGQPAAMTNMPADLSNVTAIAAGGYTVGSLALKDDGRVVQWGSTPLPSYMQRLTNVVAVAASAGSGLALIGDGPPFAADRPASRAVAVGADVSLRVGATGAHPLSYQWRFESTPLPGATRPILTIPNFQVGDVGRYTVTITNAGGALTTPPAFVSLLLRITTQPAAQIVPIGSAATFSVVASGYPPLAYQWRKHGTNITGATSSTLALDSVQVTDVALYSVLVTDAYGQEVASDSARLSIGTPGTGTGLSGDYYNSRGASQPFYGWPTFSRIDPTIDYDWSTNAPDPRITSDIFTIRWTGEVQPFASGTYTFYTRTDDGVRLWVDGRLLIDKWITQVATEWSGSIVLTGSTRYPVVLEYHDSGDRAVARLSWSSALQPKMVIPQTQLYPSAFSPSRPQLGSSLVNGTNLVLSWSGSYGVQVSANVTGIYTLMYSGRSPFTNNMSSPQRFFRLISK